MKLSAHISTIVVLAAGALTFAVPGLASSGSGSLASYQDAHERGGSVAIAQTGLAGYLDAGERAHRVQPVSATPVSTAVVEYRDAFERGQPVREILPSPVAPTVVDTGFDWGAAAIGASSGLVIAFLIGLSLIFARQSRGGRLAR